MTYNIALVKGDGIGPEIVDSAVQVLEKVGQRFNHVFYFTEYLAGGCAIDATGVPLPEETVKGCLASDSVLLGAVGGLKWDNLPGNTRPEKALLGLRSALGLYTNLRPAKLYPALRAECPLRPDIVARGFDLMMVRELTGGIYFGERGRREGKFGLEAYDTEAYSVVEMETSRLWRETVRRVAEDYPDVALSDMLVDNAAMQLVRNPSQFDVVVTSNMFGDILSDEASQITGSIGLLPSASLGATRRGLFEPIHGSAPDIAGQDRANPIATILSAAMMLRYAFDLPREADAMEAAVDAALNDGLRTADIVGDSGIKPLGTCEMTDEIIRRL